ncbi:glycine--tRNA ligase subunit beta [Bacillus inaquosorum]|uniref:Glycine--tRNA ligase beta subunit n=1 Tax=Bacillus inaquosorum KCTC 13429 TaxID=1236548 RepID=A0A9W5LJS2_9BACI|nr:glycine--tRNA ligase subunit beta [Bacillus inaquosorum]RKQ26078.1 glycine--tRNA ligase subunit beta [Bacillus subtilis]AWM17657.1 glycine--tRNA ligase subunit beta [Bacillus inaquosorum]ELS61992.1 glycyl-tRNA synthetase subunit beta [Bacillus inaquosorum KCTC 13429]MCY7906320.1 glycine--tRNA ligase subunit beta [Bacillus inaquosorum]MCY7930220.1 glycine--tRNA ligase subunit beta [Bacillus inaquosorum]
MSKQDLLLEIGLEEMPARFLNESMVQLGEKLTGWLTEKNINHGEVKLFNTPRRLAVFVKDVAEKQADIKEEAKGPAKKIALDADGNWTKAAIGFSKGQGANVEDLYIKEVKGTEYVFVQKFQAGQETKSLLPELSGLVTSLHFPKNMRWGNEDLRYIRPIKWIVALFGQDVIPFSITNVESGRTTQGHRFLGHEVSIESPSAYEEQLKEQHVIADPNVRKQMIQSQLEAMAAENNWSIPVDEDLLDEVNHLVEYPTALYGSFESEFLSIPEEVLVTTMKEHQRYFPVKDKNGDLLPHFITVRNGNSHAIENVARGNEKVLRARLSDASFFYKEDQKLNIDANVKKLENIVFHEELGSLADKVRRVTSIAEKLAVRLQADEDTLKHVKRAAEISKFDLVTHMIYEFPELQGIMGEKYARMLGEDEAVATAVNEHYMPRSAGGETPSTFIGAVVAMADKLDTIASFFSIGVIPTGSQDPYGLRRQASGIVAILLDRNWGISFEELLTFVQTEKENELLDFFTQRLKYVLNAEQIRHDVIDAVLESSELEPYSALHKAQVLEQKLGAPGFKETAEALGRVISISKKGVRGDIQPDLFENEYEAKLFDAYQTAKQNLQESFSKKDYEAALSSLSALKEPIDAYFDHTMVIADNETLKANRLAQMVNLADEIKSFANMNALIVK